MSGDDLGFYTLERGGTYQVIVGNPDANSPGDYAFQLLLVPEPQSFQIALDDTVSDTYPADGSGVIEQPGSQDIFTFTAEAGQRVFIKALESVSAGDFIWRLVDEQGRELFEKNFVSPGSDLGFYTLERGGTYRVIVGDPDANRPGAYSFRIQTAEE